MEAELLPQCLPIKPVSHPLKACVRVPGSKSLTNRALMLAALARGTTRISNALFSDDSLYFASALQTLGFNLALDPKHACILVSGLGGIIPAERADIFIGNAGTAARFLTALLTLASGQYTLDGDARMRERPIGDLVNALVQLGADVTPLNPQSSGIYPPLQFNASGLSGGSVRIAGNISSQYVSALLMVAPYARSSVEIEISTELNSKPYVDMTLAIMNDFGVSVERENYKRFSVQFDRYTPPENYVVESDASAAACFFAAPALCGGSLRVEHISRDSRQGDIRFLDVLASMGCRVVEGENYIEVSAPEKLCGVDVDMRDISDTALTLAALAPFADSPTCIRGIASARVKECDRIHTACTELGRLGVRVDEHEDGLTIYPIDKIRPALVHTYNDHRMAMAFSLIGLRAAGISIENPACVSKTFPDFFDVLETLQ